MAPPRPLPPHPLPPPASPPSPTPPPTPPPRRVGVGGGRRSRPQCSGGGAPGVRGGRRLRGLEPPLPAPRALHAGGQERVPHGDREAQRAEREIGEPPRIGRHVRDLEV